MRRRSRRSHRLRLSRGLVERAPGREGFASLPAFSLLSGGLGFWRAVRLRTLVCALLRPAVSAVASLPRSLACRVRLVSNSLAGSPAPANSCSGRRLKVTFSYLRGRLSCFFVMCRGISHQHNSA
eukprot:4809908-Prymnesium_polylepis.1